MPSENPPFMAGVPELLILRLLKGREMYGYEIVQAIRQQTSEVVSLGEGVVYPVLHALEKGGALRSRRAPVNGRPRVYYSLTAEGTRRLYHLTDKWLSLNDAVAAVLRGLAGKGESHAV
jgi:PadR family transcriptional regulator PadR